MKSSNIDESEMALPFIYAPFNRQSLLTKLWLFSKTSFSLIIYKDKRIFHSCSYTVSKICIPLHLKELKFRYAFRKFYIFNQVTSYL